MKYTNKETSNEIMEAVAKIYTALDKALNEKKEEIDKKFIGTGISREDIEKAVEEDEHVMDCENCSICNPIDCEDYADCQGVDDEPESWNLSLREIVALALAGQGLIEDIDATIVDDFIEDLFSMMRAEGYVIMREVEDYAE